MAAPAPTNRVPLDVYLRTAFEPDAEYVDGVIEERPKGEYDHSSWQHAIEVWFSQHANEWNIRVRPELRVRVTPGNFRVPDVTILDRNHAVEQIITHPPIAVIEIMSSEDTLPKMMKKLRDYEQMGIQTILVLDPGSDEHYRFSKFGLIPLGKSAFDVAGSSCRFDLEEIKQLLD